MHRPPRRSRPAHRHRQSPLPALSRARRSWRKAGSRARGPILPLAAAAAMATGASFASSATAAGSSSLVCSPRRLPSSASHPEATADTSGQDERAGERQPAAVGGRTAAAEQRQRQRVPSWDSPAARKREKGAHPPNGGGGFNGCGPAPPPLPVRARLSPSFASLLPAISPRRWQLSCRCGLPGDLIPPGRKEGKAGRGSFQAGPAPPRPKTRGWGWAGRPNRCFAACKWKRKAGRRERIVRFGLSAPCWSLQ